MQRDKVQPVQHGVRVLLSRRLFITLLHSHFIYRSDYSDNGNRDPSPCSSGRRGMDQT